MNPFDPGYYGSDELRSFGFARVGENVLIAKNCTIIGPENIEIGDGTRIDAGTTIIAAAARVRLLGFNHIGGNGHFSAAADLTMGLYSGTSQGVRIYTGTEDYSGRWMTGPCVPAHLRRARIEPVTIGDHCILGSGTVVLPGCNLADGVAVGALSLVTKPLAEWTLYHGNPARRVAKRDRRVLALAACLEGSATAAA